MDVNLKGKKALVCGSTQGIGKAAAIELAKLGADVVLLARNEQSLKLTVSDLPNNGSQQHDHIVADYSDQKHLKEAVETYLKRSGPINILVNNTGGPPAGPITLAKPEEFLAAFNNHLVCNHILAQACLEGMKQSGYGRIINIISTSVKIPLPNLGVSNTVRAAVGNWAKTMANELAKFGITVNNVLPGATLTQRLTGIIENRSTRTQVEKEEIEKEMMSEIPMGRFAQASEVANAVAFLASPAASYITGINLPVDGGRTGNL
jgi:3-oxoacyl-[acyl-carrier protein] reductase